MQPTDLDLLCLQRQGISGFSRTWVKGTCSKLKELKSPYSFGKYGNCIKVLFEGPDQLPVDTVCLGLLCLSIYSATSIERHAVLDLHCLHKVFLAL